MSRPERDEELLSVQSIYCDEFNTFEVIDLIHFRFRSVPIVLSITVPLSYPEPSHLPEISIDSDGLGVSQMQMFQLRARLEGIVQSKPDELLLFDLTEETREFTEGLRDDIRISLEEEEEEECEDIWTTGDYDQRVTDQTLAQSHMGSVTIDSIMERLPRSIRLFHAESVLRQDLRRKYLDMRREIQRDATSGVWDRRAKDAAWDKYGREEVVFHGTLRRNVGSIVRSGFIVPGRNTAAGERVEIRCGSTWGQGIYTSPDPEYSLNYTDYITGEVKGQRRLLPGQKLIVCVIMMGRRNDMVGTRHLNPTVEQGYHSHVSPSKLEYIVFNSAQLLPLFVLHLGDGHRSYDPMYSQPSSLGGANDDRASLTEYARKYLPNGFGAASGHRFAVEAIAPVDDDEELWGEYQDDRDLAMNGEFQEERWISQWANYYG